MVDNQHKRIKGYRDLSIEDIAMMNEIKAMEANWNHIVDRLRSDPSYDQRQVSIAATDGESAFMRAVRAVAQPERISVDGRTAADIAAMLQDFEGQDNTPETRAAIVERLERIL